MTQAISPRTTRRRSTVVLHTREPAYSAMAECLRIQSQATPRGRAARVFGVNPLLPEARNCFAGAVGEMTVGDALERLGPGWSVLHAIPVGSGVDVDHLVIGPAGVFTISTKSYPGRRVFADGHTLTVGGVKTDHIRNSLSEGRRASKLLALAIADLVPVVPLIVVIGAASIAMGRTPPAVEVMNEGGLYRWLTSRKATLGATQVAQLSAAARDRATWPAPPLVLGDTLRNVQRFERLQAEVDAARHRRAKWSLFGGLAVIVLSTAAVFLTAAMLSGGL